MITPIITYSQDNYNQAAEYIRVLAGSEDAAVTFQTFDDDEERKDPTLAKGWHDTLANSWVDLCKLNKEGAGVYVTIQQTDGTGKRTADNIVAVRTLALDFDGVLPSEFHLPPSIVDQNSSANKRGHVHWVLSEPVVVAKEEYKTLVLRLCAHYGAEAKADTICCDLPRVFRLPGFCNMKPKYFANTGEAPTLKLLSTSAVTYTIAEIMAGVAELPKEDKPAPKPKAKAKPTTKAPSPSSSADYEEELKHHVSKLRKAKEGQRNLSLNNAKFTLAGLFPDKLDAMDEVLTEAGLELGLSAAEIKATLDSANKGAERPITSTRVKPQRRSKTAEMREALEEYYEGALQWDEMKNKFRFAEDLLTDVQLWNKSERELEIDLPFHNWRRMATDYAQRNPYHAARAYLQSLTVATDPTPILSALYQAMGIYQPLHRLYVRKWLISAVARAIEPGCKADVALVLQGEQGIRKTSFFNALFGEFFQTLGEHKSDVDQLLSMARSWCVEYGEIENAFSRKAVAAIKSFMSTNSDTYRRPYASEPDEYPRHFVICGTTNQGEFLSDSTGNRRFWVVPASEDIDTEAITQMRDDVWSAAMALFLAEEEWWLNKSQTALAALDTAQYEQVSPWEETIATYLTHHTPCTTKDIMENALGFETSRCNDKKAQAEITSILHKLKCVKKECRHNGVKGRYWFNPTLEGVTADDVKVTKENIPAVEYY